MVEFPFLTLIPTDDPASSFWCGLSHGFCLTFAFSSPSFLCARTFIHEGFNRGVVAYTVFASSVVLFLSCIFTGQVQIVQWWSDWEPFLYVFGFFLTLQVTAHLLRGARRMSFSLLLAVISVGALSNPPLIFPVTRFIMRGEMMDVATTPYLLGVFLSVVVFGMLVAVLVVRSLQWFFVGVTAVKPKLVQSTSYFTSFMPGGAGNSEGVGTNEPGESSQASLGWDFSPQTRALALRKASNVLLFLNLGLLMTGCAQYSWRSFVQYPFEFTRNYNMQRNFSAFDTGIRHREHPLPVNRHSSVDQFIQDRSRNYSDEGGESTRGVLTLVQKNEIYLRHKKHLFQRLNKLFTRQRVTFRTPYERLMGVEQVHAMRSYQAMYDQDELPNIFGASFSLDSTTKNSQVDFDGSPKNLRNDKKGSPKFSYVRPSTD